jgi:uncharacterized protein (TIGR02246 family)
MNFSRINLLMILVTIVAVPVATTAATKEDVAAASQAWAEALNNHDLERILALYDPEAILLGTVSPIVRDTPAKVRDYFKTLPNQPNLKVVLGEQHVRVYSDTAINTGTYTFYTVRDGQPVTIPARFSFVYRLRNGHWMIVDHHSSAMPTPPQ